MLGPQVAVELDDQPSGFTRGNLWPNSRNPAGQSGGNPLKGDALQALRHPVQILGIERLFAAQRAREADRRVRLLLAAVEPGQERDHCRNLGEEGRKMLEMAGKAASAVGATSGTARGYDDAPL